jgi:uncharacterized protein YndB with AHSA1/START domain
MKVSDNPIVVEQSYKCNLNTVWSAITDVNEMREWFFGNIAEFEPKVGFKTRFAVQSEDRTFTHLWDITKVVPLKTLEYRWCYKEYPGDSLMFFELLDQGNTTLLRLSTRVLADFPDDIPEFTRESAVEGWNYLLGKSLKEYLEKN